MDFNYFPNRLGIITKIIAKIIYNNQNNVEISNRTEEKSRLL